MKVYLDTNVYLDLFCKRRWDYITSQIIDRSRSCEFYIVISDLVLFELKKYVDFREIKEMIEFLGVKAILVKRSNDLSPILGLHFPDNVHMHTAAENNCDIFITNDFAFLNRSFRVRTLSSPFL